MNDDAFMAEVERLYLSYEAELTATQASIAEYEERANYYRDRHSQLLRDRSDAMRRLNQQRAE